MRNIILFFLCLTSLLLAPIQEAHAMFFSNGDFESGNLSGWFVQEDFSDVVSSPLVNAIDDGTGNHVGEIHTGFTSNGIFTASLGRDIGMLPLSAQDLFFDFKVFDSGSDQGGGSSFIDLLTISLLSDSGDLNPILTADILGYSILDPSLTSVSLLSNGFYRVNTNVSSLGGANNSKLFFDLFDDDDARLTRAWVDNLDLTEKSASNVVPEPATLLLLGTGFFSFVGIRKRSPKSI